MSFDVNIGRTQPVIKAAVNTNNDGGSGGNTGFMMRGKRKKDEKDNKSLFSSEPGLDSFEMGSKLPKNYDELFEEKKNWLDNIVNKFKK
jgi:hypothetical protein